MNTLKDHFILGITVISIARVALGFLYEYKQSHKPIETTTAMSPRPSPQYFLMLGDTGADSVGQHAVASLAKKKCDEVGGCEAAFIAGDIIYENGVTSIEDKQFQTKFEIPYKDLSFPFYIAYGNHDYGGCTECYLAYTSHSTKWQMPSPYYVQNFGPMIDFFVIDTEQFTVSQQTWLKEEFAKSQSLYKVVVGHRPIKTFETTKVGEYWSGKKELQDIICQQANYYISGHSHVLEDNGKLDGCKTNQLVTGGGGASIRTIDKSSDGLFSAAKNGFIILKVTSNDLTHSFTTL